MVVCQWDEALRDYETVLKMTDGGDQELRQKIRQCKLEQKKAKRKDYYKILELSKDATLQDIKKSYKKLALVRREIVLSLAPARGCCLFFRRLVFISGPFPHVVSSGFPRASDMAPR